MGSRGKSKNARHGLKAGKMSQLAKGVSNLGLKHRNSNLKKNNNGNLDRLGNKSSGPGVEQVNKVDLSNSKSTNNHKESNGSEYQNENTTEAQADAIIDDKDQYAKDDSASTEEQGNAKLDTQSLVEDFTKDKQLEQVEGDKELQSLDQNQGSATADLSPVKEINTFGDIDATDLADTAPVSGHKALHVSTDIELLETDKPTKLEISTTIEVPGDAKDFEIDQNNECHFGSPATGANTTLKAESSQVVQAADGSDIAIEKDATKAGPASGLAADHSNTTSLHAVCGTPSNEVSPVSGEATFGKHVADVMEVDDDHTVQNGKAAAPVHVGWLEKIRNLFYV